MPSQPDADPGGLCHQRADQVACPAEGKVRREHHLPHRYRRGFLGGWVHMVGNDIHFDRACCGRVSGGRQQIIVPRPTSAATSRCQSTSLGPCHGPRCHPSFHAILGRGQLFTPLSGPVYDAVSYQFVTTLVIRFLAHQCARDANIVPHYNVFPFQNRIVFCYPFIGRQYVTLCQYNF